MKTMYRIKELYTGEFIIQEKIFGLLWFKAFDIFYDELEEAQDDLYNIELNNI